MKRDPDIHNTRPIDIKRVESERPTYHYTSAIHTFRKRATNYRALLRERTCKDQASYGSSPSCSTRPTDIKRVKLERFIAKKRDAYIRMRWLRLVGSFTLEVSFADFFSRDLVQISFLGILCKGAVGSLKL